MTEVTEQPAIPETTGRFIVTFKEGAKTEAMNALKKGAGIAKADIMNSADFQDDGVSIEQVPDAGGVFFENLGIAVMNMDNDAAGAFAADAGGDSAVLAIEPEGIMYALSELATPSSEYLRGFRDASNAVYNGLRGEAAAAAFAQDAQIAATFADTAALTWGLQATRAANSAFTGKNRKIAVLDTGLDLNHPDFRGRAITKRSFIPGVASVQDGHSHGTHCIGTACGPKNPTTGRRYGVAGGSQIFVGKVLSDGGSGGDIGILAGIDWAVQNKCHVISMSLGADVPNTSVAYETAGQRALNAGSLIVAAASNNARRSLGNFGFVGRPANSRTMMAVAALDSSFAMANFSPRDTALRPGTAIDIAAPGVAIHSTVPVAMGSYGMKNGTSMATPHVAGIAALWAEATGATGAALWQRVMVNARSLPLPGVDVGRGLVRSP
jgi:subtilisin family serine protease